ncbi:UU173 family protein [Mycoplasmopsis cynos]|uniref:DUF2779 domain-containing protein n=1 Tax=Mycoplasmopsis cynos (strain C142) TaxID=1246955 RepID=L0RW80_MYCC1|nr:DUF2779 domain-containing protein [Mycoplasmopsis cynos]CCP23886.1 Putative uncharacterized protein [Mycoplasmopsis cynos C142]
MNEINKEIIINWNTFKRVFALNPALIFNKENIIEDLRSILNKYKTVDVNDETNFDEDDEDENKSTIKYDLLEDGINQDSIGNLHELFFDSNDQKMEEYIKFIATNYALYKTKAEDFIINELNLKKENIVIISNTTKQDIKIKQTYDALINAIKNNETLFIFNPVFGYSEELEDLSFKFISNSFGIYVNNKNVILYNLSYTSTSQRNQYFLAFYNYWLLKENNIELKDIRNIIIDPRDVIFKRVKKAELNFMVTNSALLTKKITKKKNALKKEFLPYILDIDLFIKKAGLLRNIYDDKSNNQNYNFPSILNGFDSDLSFIQSAKEKVIKSNLYEVNYDMYTIEKLDILNSFYDANNKKLNNLMYSNNQRWQNLYCGIESGSIFNKYYSLLNVKEKKPKIEYIFQEFKWYTNIIKLAYKHFLDKTNLKAILYFASNNEKEISSVMSSWIKTPSNPYVFSGCINISDEFISDAKEILQLLREIVFLKNNDEYVLFSGNFANNNAIKFIGDLKNKIQEFKSIPNLFNADALNKIIKLHIKDAKISWYDYEGFSDIIPPCDGIGSYIQAVFQVSVIHTKNGVETSTTNIVCDPHNLNKKDFVEIIDAIYGDAADYYVVFNKTYENTRNKEMLNLVKNDVINNKDPEFNKWLLEHYKKEDVLDALKIFESKIMKINSNTIDLLDVFIPHKISMDNIEKIYEFNIKNNDFIFKKPDEKVLSICKLPLFYAKDLKFFSSIKKVEKFITENKLKLRNLITPYSELKIQKGQMAMQEAISRYLGATNKAVWENTICPELKKYCENDVRAMIMVYDLIMHVANKIFSNMNEFEYKINQDEVVNKNLKYDVENSKLILK